MRRYFFHTQDGHPFHDEDGTLLPNDEAARVEAARVLGQLVNEHPSDVWRDDQFRIIVADGAGLTLFTLDLSAFVSPAGGSTDGRVPQRLRQTSS